MKIGCDVVSLKRIDGREETLSKGILSDKELSLYDKAFHKREFLGGRFAAKEAFLKATGSGLRLTSMKNIEILPLESGEPILYFEGKSYHVSISHDGDYAFAVCVLENL